MMKGAMQVQVCRRKHLYPHAEHVHCFASLSNLYPVSSLSGQDDTLKVIPSNMIQLGCRLDNGRTSQNRAEMDLAVYRLVGRIS